MLLYLNNVINNIINNNNNSFAAFLSSKMTWKTYKMFYESWMISLGFWGFKSDCVCNLYTAKLLIQSSGLLLAHFWDWGCSSIATPASFSHPDLLPVFQVVEAMSMNQYPLYSCYLVLLGVCLGFMVLYYVCLKFIKQKSSQDWWTCLDPLYK